MIDVLLAAVSLSLASAPRPAEPVQPRPAVFVVHDDDTTIYIFGTFHALDGQCDWFNGNLKSAFEGSQELVLETLLPEGPNPVAQVPVTTTVPQSLAGYAVAPSASFLATTRLAVSAGRSQGMSLANGADMVLRHIAESEGKDVQALETFDSQLRMFSRMPAAAPARPTVAGNASSAGDMPHLMAEMESAWERGDQTVFVGMLDQLRRGSPDTYRMMFAERNARWADWIAARLRSPGTVFVAVGVGHLAGKDSVLVRLAEHGIESARLN